MTTTPTELFCPTCGGEQIPDQPGGILVIRHTITCTVLAAEDATLNADHDRRCWVFTRPATDTERILLAAAGYAVPDQLDTRIRYITAGVRRRTWDGLKAAEAES